ncbi:HD domain-containing protein [Tissierella carlieri]|uniref:HD domain-containing protein n=1 Tax=Tissierella TaxID=41273 RepID=UPI000BA00CC3|nr:MULTISPECIES: HD domain-containing protein [Tissierella]MBU5312255.1 HD domain-containing protein [Tissierella carlieri]OZV13699.1 hydrolase [Tissierella sp. P1]
MIKERLLKDIEFIVELDKMKSILRQTSLINEDRREDDAQHSWHISVMAMILGEYSNEKIDICKVIKMLLTHDLVEIFAGDTFCYDKVGNEDKKERENLAAEKIFGMLEEDKGRELRVLWDEFEDGKTSEALFAASMDRLQPMLSNYYNNGGTWKKFNVAKEDIYKRIAPVKKSSDELWSFVENMIEDAYDKGLISK